MLNLRVPLALLRGGPSGTRQTDNAPSAVDSDQSDIDRRAHPRLTASEVLSISKVRLRYGPEVTLIDLSSGGAQIEMTNLGLQPGATVSIEITGKKGRRAIAAEVLRCQLASLRPQLIYRVALAFTHAIDLRDLTADVEPQSDDPSPAREGERLGDLITRLLPVPSEQPASGHVPKPAVFDALEAALSTLESPAGRRAGAPLATALAGLFRATTDFLLTAPTSTALVAAVEELLRRAIPARAIRDAESFLQLPGSEAFLFTVPSLDAATPVRQLAIEFAEGTVPLELHLQMLKAGVQLIAIARELGRLIGDDRPLTTLARPDASSVPEEVIMNDDGPNMPEPIVSSEYQVEKWRTAATLVLSNGQVVHGHFFMGDSIRGEGRELVGELLNGTKGFFPFERTDAGVVLYNPAHVVLVTLAENEARRVPGYEVARRHVVSLLLSNSQRIVGAVHAHLPSSHDRVSDWARDQTTFRYLEADEATVIVNVQHVTEVTEIEPA